MPTKNKEINSENILYAIVLTCGYLYKSHSVKSKRLSYLYPSDTVDVLSVGKKWAKVKISNDEGYIQISNLRFIYDQNDTINTLYDDHAVLSCSFYPFKDYRLSVTDIETGKQLVCNDGVCINMVPKKL